MARPEGFEPPTAWFVARYSIQLSYGRVFARSRIIHRSSMGVKYFSGFLPPFFPLQLPETVCFLRRRSYRSLMTFFPAISRP